MGERGWVVVARCGFFVDPADAKCLSGLGWGRTYSGYFNTEVERGPRRTTEKGRMALRAKRIKIIADSSARWSVPRIFSVALRGPRSSSVLKSGRWGSTDDAPSAPALTP